MSQYGEDATVAVLGLGERELGEHMPDVRFDRAFAEEQPPRDPAVREPFGHQLEHMPFPIGQRGQRIVVASPRHQAGHNLRVQGGPTAGHALGRREELADVEHAILQQVTESAQRHEANHVRRFDVLGQQQYADVRMRALHRLGRPRPLVAERRRHPDVRHDKIRPVRRHGRQLAPVSVLFALFHLLVFLGMVAFARSVSSRGARVGSALALVGTFVFFLAEFATIPFADQRMDETGPQIVGAAFGLGVTLTAVGLIVAGISVLRSGGWHWWRRYAPLGAGLWSLVMIGLSFTGALAAGVAIYGISLCVLYLAVYTLPTEEAPAKRVARLRARIDQ
jgi:hypothetical protein